MKKMNVRSELLKTAAILIAVGGFVFLPSPAFSVDQFIPKIISVKGDVRVLEGKDSDWKPAQENMFLKEGAQINTGIEGVCEITFDDGLQNLMSVRSLSRATLTSVNPPYISIAKGKYFALLEALNGNTFSVDSGVAVASVRGSALWVEYNDSLKNMVVSAMQHDAVIESERYGNQLLEQGKTISISKSIGYSKKQVIPGSQRIEWNDWMQSVRRLKIMRPDVKTVQSVKISDAHKAYYVENPCAELVPCEYKKLTEDRKRSALDHIKDSRKNNHFEERESLLLHLDDEVDQNSLIEMPYDISMVQLKLGTMLTELHGTMIVSVEITKRQKLKLELFQAGKYKYEVSNINGVEKLVIYSGNKYGLRTSRVTVDEGVVALRMPWLCGRENGSDQTFEIEAGQCFEQYIGGLENKIEQYEAPLELDEPPTPLDTKNNILQIGDNK